MTQFPEERWYYTVETEPGVFTEGTDRENLALIRKLLRNINIAGMDCLDFGTQEAVVPILLKRAGARWVVAYDRFDYTNKINYLAGIYGVDFKYVSGIQARELPARLDSDVGTRLFDLVVFSGVLYHLIDPLGILALVRGFVKTGGLFVIETVVQENPGELLLFNAKGAVYGKGSNYFVPTTGWLDYVLRLLSLRPLHGVYLGKLSPKTFARLALLCRAEEMPCPLDAADEWMLGRNHRKTFQAEAQVDWSLLARTQSEITYQPFDSRVATIDGRGLTSCLAKHRPYECSPEEVRLYLSARL